MRRTASASKDLIVEFEDSRLDFRGGRLSVDLRGGYSRSEKSKQSPFSDPPAVSCLTHLMKHMLLYKCLSFSPKNPRVCHKASSQYLPSPIRAVLTYNLCLNRLMATASRQPLWQQPTAPDDANLPKIVVYNSLTRSKVPFVPLDWQTKKVSWYNCGPTTWVV